MILLVNSTIYVWSLTNMTKGKKNLANQIQQHIQLNKVRFISVIKCLFNIPKSTNMIYHNKNE